MLILGIVVTSFYFLIGNAVLLIFHTNAYGKGKINVADYIKWQWLWPLPVLYVFFIGIRNLARKMARKVWKEKKEGN